MLKKYEVTFSCLSDIQASGLKAIIKKVKGLATSTDSRDGNDASGSLGGIHLILHCGVKKLSYPIRKATQARFYILHIECLPSAVDSINLYLKRNEGIVRHFISVLEEGEEPVNLVEILAQNNKSNVSSSSDADFNISIDNL